MNYCLRLQPAAHNNHHHRSRLSLCLSNAITRLIKSQLNEHFSRLKMSTEIKRHLVRRSSRYQWTELESACQFTPHRNTPIMTHLWLRFLAITRKYLFIQIHKTQSRERDPKNPPRSPFTTRYWSDSDWLPFASLRANHIAQRQELLLHH